MHEVAEEPARQAVYALSAASTGRRNGKYVVCFMLEGKYLGSGPGDVELARAQRQSFMRGALRRGGRSTAPAARDCRRLVARALRAARQQWRAASANARNPQLLPQPSRCR